MWGALKVCPECGDENIGRVTCCKCHEKLYPSTKPAMSEETKQLLKQKAAAKKIDKLVAAVESTGGGDYRTRLVGDGDRDEER